MSVYGYERLTTPNIDAFASKAIVFDNAYSTSNWTLPSHTSIFSSQYPIIHNATTIETAISQDSVLLAEVLQENGFSNTAFTGGAFVTKEYGFARGFESFDDVHGLRAEEMFSNAINWVDSDASDEKFFLFLHTFQPHDPYKKRQEVFEKEPYEPISDSEALELFEKKFSDQNLTAQQKLDLFNYSFTSERIFGKVEPLNPFFAKLIQDTNNYSKKLLDNYLKMTTFYNSDAAKELSDFNDSLSFIVDSYDSTLFDADIQFAKFIKKLEEKNLLDKTVIILLSDHGEAFMEHDSFFHARTIYNEEIHIPLIIKYPNNYHARVKESVSLVDVSPTVLQSLKIDSPDSFHGMSLLNVLHGSKRGPIFSEKVGTTVIQDNWKLISQDGLTEVYDLSKDPDEQENLASTNPEKLEELQGILNAFVVFGKENSITPSESSVVWDS